jgi:uncharacterized membrane protein
MNKEVWLLLLAAIGTILAMLMLGALVAGAFPLACIFFALIVIDAITFAISIDGR